MIRTTVLAMLSLALLAPVPLASGQPSISASVGQGLESLAPTGASGETQGEIGGAASLAYAFAGERTRVGYDVEVSTYAVPGDWHTVSHVLSGRHRFDAGRDGRAHLYVGGNVTMRRNGAAWDAANFDALGGFANYELKRSATSSFRAGYRMDVRRFGELTGLEHLEQGAFGSILVNLRTRTTLIGEIAVGWKHYSGGASPTAADPASATPPSPSAPAAPPSGTGVGGPRGMGGRLHDTWTSMPTVTPSGTPGALAPSDARTVTVYARVAQSLATRTGVAFDVTRRSASGQLPSSVVSTPARFFDDGVYDDPFASDATDLRAGFTSIFRGEIELSAGARRMDEPYGATPALDATGAPVAGVLRHDHVARGWVLVTVPVLPRRTGAFEVSVVSGYDFTRHESTTAAYNYAAHAVRVGLAVEY